MKTLGFSPMLKLLAIVEDNTKSKFRGNFVAVVVVFFSSFFCELFFLRQIRVFPFVINVVSWGWQKCQEQPPSL